VCHVWSSVGERHCWGHNGLLLQCRTHGGTLAPAAALLLVGIETIYACLCVLPQGPWARLKPRLCLKLQVAQHDFVICCTGCHAGWPMA